MDEKHPLEEAPSHTMQSAEAAPLDSSDAAFGQVAENRGNALRLRAIAAPQASSPGPWRSPSCSSRQPSSSIRPSPPWKASRTLRGSTSRWSRPSAWAISRARRLRAGWPLSPYRYTRCSSSRSSPEQWSPIATSGWPPAETRASPTSSTSSSILKTSRPMTWPPFREKSAACVRGSMRDDIRGSFLYGRRFLQKSCKMRLLDEASGRELSYFVPNRRSPASPRPGTM